MQSVGLNLSLLFMGSIVRGGGQEIQKEDHSLAIPFWNSRPPEDDTDRLYLNFGKNLPLHSA